MLTTEREGGREGEGGRKRHGSIVGRLAKRLEQFERAK